jgi:hypothetical protein
MKAYAEKSELPLAKGKYSRPQDDIVEQSSTVGSASAAEHRRFLRKNVRADGQVRNMGFAPFTPALQVRT